MHQEYSIRKATILNGYVYKVYKLTEDNSHVLLDTFDTISDAADFLARQFRHI